MKKTAYKDRKRIGKVVYETILYVVKMDIDGETYSYADLGGWDAGEVRDSDGLEETIEFKKTKKKRGS